MPVPKRRRSKSEKRKKKACFKIEAPNTQPCPACGNLVLSHRVCPECGKYKGRQVITIKVKETPKKDKKG
jgi:large subunit ribosomal protein L32